MGWFALQVEAGPADAPELGYRLHAQAWGKGFATEGAQVLVRKAFTELGAQRVWATTITVNTASRRVMEKAGLRYVRTFFMEWPDVIEGGEHGDVEYALTRTEWQAQQREWLDGSRS
jgi:RimJ/RimL family protein N-acetyltransferase